MYFFFDIFSESSICCKIPVKETLSTSLMICYKYKINQPLYLSHMRFIFSILLFRVWVSFLLCNDIFKPVECAELASNSLDVLSPKSFFKDICLCGCSGTGLESEHWGAEKGGSLQYRIRHCLWKQNQQKVGKAAEHHFLPASILTRLHSASGRELCPPPSMHCLLDWASNLRCTSYLGGTHNCCEWHCYHKIVTFDRT